MSLDKDRPFTDIDEQIKRLEKRGVETDSETARILLAEGYYCVVNGYKEPFIDLGATKENGEDTYKPGTTFNDIYALFSFDRELRELTFHYLLKVEALIRTVTTYTFAEAHREKNAFLDRSNFATSEDYRKLGLRQYGKNMDKLQEKLNDLLNNPRNEAIKYYKDEYGHVPLWVLSTTMPFGTIEHFFHFMKRVEQKSVCERIADLTSLPFENKKALSARKARRAIDILVKFRNICAHDERLYCASVDSRNPVDYFGCVKYASKFMPISDYFEFIGRIFDTVNSYNAKSGQLYHILSKSGFVEFSDTELPKFERYRNMLAHS